VSLPWWFSNLAVAALVLAGIGTGVAVRRNEIWRGAARSLWRRRRFSLAVVGAYVGVALLDSIVWTGGAIGQGDAVAAAQPRSVIDRAFERAFAPEGSREKSYSAPLARAEFYGDAPLSHPGRHLLGTDVLGRDVLYMTFKGARVALLIGSLTSLIAIPLALLFGVAAGYFGGWIDDLIFFLISVLSSIPNLLLLVALIIVLGRGPLQVCLALGITSWVGFCLLSRAETFKLRELGFVEAARALGVPPARTILRHVLPNLAHLIVINFALRFSGLVLSETILSYLGIGVDGSWGQMIDQARDELSRDPMIWWNLAAATGALFLLILCVNLIGDALRDVLDPRTLRERE
jgi:peptide/nickel transport system permease protein